MFERQSSVIFMQSAENMVYIKLDRLIGVLIVERTVFSSIQLQCPPFKMISFSGAVINHAFCLYCSVQALNTPPCCCCEMLY